MAAIDPASLPPSREIPFAITASVRSWWSLGEKECAISEERLLRRLAFFRSKNPQKAGFKSENPPDSLVTAYSQKVALSKPNQYINTFSMVSTAPLETAPPPAILLHGYGAGLGFFYRNFPALGQWAGQRGTQVHALDWLGMGRSARVPFTIKAKRDDIPGRVAEAESFFVDSLEEWRQKMGLEKMTLIGHSLGAYFSVVYALKYPARVNKLILLSPAGVPRDKSYTEPSRELTDEIDTNPPGQAVPTTKGKVERIRAGQKAGEREWNRSRRLYTYLWEEGWSPFQLIRSTFFLGPMLIGKHYTSRRFPGLTEEDTRDMHDYIINITLAKGSGEYCISHILAPGAYARMPLVDRISALKIPVTFVYGDHDWMDPEGGSQSVEKLRQAGNGKGRMYIIGNAGHHVYLDNVKAVNNLMIKDLDRH